ncbi:MAG: peptidoglycan DD-metalloendopeptidase family protein [Alistipes sp.]|nr:peptidoglycan DD-metalloendopeptidase family protein [Alistipes sp.]
MKKCILFFITALLAVACNRGGGDNAEKQHTIVYGIIADDYNLERGEIGNGQTLGSILNEYGISALTIDRLDRASRDIFPLRQIRAGRPYTAFLTKDTIASKLDYLVYEKNVTDYVIFGFVGDSISITTGQKPIELRRTKRSAQIESSLWGAIMRDSLPYALAAELEDVYQWTVDFFGIQQGDKFTVIYDEKFVDTLSVGVGRIWGAKFTHGGKDIYAIPFKQGDKIQYWEYDGGSLRKQMLKAPLKFSRISSKFSNSRFHPVLKRYRPHHGVDYAAPKGTPVRAVADGVVVFRGWGGGGGNTLKIKHANNLMTGYLHLSGFAKGIVKGKRVSQGDVIGYVGSTGTSTGPHLDYRVWKGGTPINPLNIPQEPAIPISKENREAFEYVRDCIAAELNDLEGDYERITQLDSIVLPKKIEEELVTEK